MRALQLVAPSTFEMVDLPLPAPKGDEVLVRVAACGICGSDVHGMDGSTGRRLTPLVMGHEAAGTVADVGAEVQGWQEGDRVTFDSTLYCGECDFCKKGQINLCDRRQVLGVACQEFRRDGAFADYVAVPARILYRLPDDLPFDRAAMVEPVSIALHAVSRAGDVREHRSPTCASTAPRAREVLFGAACACDRMNLRCGVLFADLRARQCYAWTSSVRGWRSGSKRCAVFDRGPLDRDSICPVGEALHLSSAGRPEPHLLVEASRPMSIAQRPQDHVVGFVADCRPGAGHQQASDPSSPRIGMAVEADDLGCSRVLQWRRMRERHDTTADLANQQDVWGYQQTAYRVLPSRSAAFCGNAQELRGEDMVVGSDPRRGVRLADLFAVSVDCRSHTDSCVTHAAQYHTATRLTGFDFRREHTAAQSKCQIGISSERCTQRIRAASRPEIDRSE